MQQHATTTCRFGHYYMYMYVLWIASDEDGVNVRSLHMLMTEWKQ